MVAVTSAACARARLPTHQIVGMGEAFRIAREEMGTELERIRMLHQRMLAGLKGIEEVYINGDLEQRVPHNVNASFNFVEGESLIMGVKGIAVSSAVRPAPRPAWSPAMCCARWAVPTNWRTPACA